MSSLSSALSVALTGLRADTAAVQVISGNVSNAQTKGYTEKGVVFEPITLGTDLGGVGVSQYTRVTDTVLSSTLNQSTSQAAMLSTQNDYMQQVQAVLGSSSNNPALSTDIANLQSAWNQYAAAPDDATQQKSLIQTAQQFTTDIQTLSGQIATLDSQVVSDTQTTVTTLNNDLSQIQNLNVQITAAISSSQPTGNLEDQRDQLVNNVASITNIQVMNRANGQIALYTPQGTTLIDGQAQTFTYNGSTVLNSAGQDVSSVLTGGKLQAQLDFRANTSPAAASASPTSEVIRKLQSQLGNFVNMFVSTAAGNASASGTFAQAYNAGAAGSNELNTGFFTATLNSNGLPDPSTFSVNAALLNGSQTVKQSIAQTVANTFNATNLAIVPNANPALATTSSTFTADGLTLNNQTYANVATAILSGFQQTANTLKTSSTSAAAQQTFYQNSYASETGVNIDSELVALTNFQNSYAAVAHVVNTVNSMMTTLVNSIPS